jgi:hypothetical protein
VVFSRRPNPTSEVLGLVFLSGLVSGGSGEAQRGSSANKY